MAWLSLRRASAGMSVDGSGCFCCGESGAGMGVDGNGCFELRRKSAGMRGCLFFMNKQSRDACRLPWKFAIAQMFVQVRLD